MFKEMMNEVFSKVQSACEEMLAKYAGAKQTERGIGWDSPTDAAWFDKVEADLWNAFRVENSFVDFDSLYSVSFDNFQFTIILLYDAHEYKIRIKNANA